MLNDSKTVAYKRMRFGSALKYMLPLPLAELDEIQEGSGGDPWPYMVRSNRKRKRRWCSLQCQSIIERKFLVDQLTEWPELEGGLGIHGGEAVTGILM